MSVIVRVDQDVYDRIRQRRDEAGLRSMSDATRDLLGLPLEEPADECWTPGCRDKHHGCYAITNHGDTTITYAGPEELACTIDITYVMLCRRHGEGPVREAITGAAT
jgi:hypothetical protein